MTNLSLGGNTAYAGIVQMLNAGQKYDLVFICYGQNDDSKLIKFQYEELLQVVMSRCPEAYIVCILESSQKDYTSKITDIQTLCEYYNIPVVDTIDAYSSSGLPYDELSNDGVHPNDQGYEIYYNETCKIIDRNYWGSGTRNGK